MVHHSSVQNVCHSHSLQCEVVKPDLGGGGGGGGEKGNVSNKVGCVMQQEQRGSCRIAEVGVTFCRYPSHCALQVWCCSLVWL